VGYLFHQIPRLRRVIVIYEIDARDDDITIDGTLDLCSDLKVDPEDVALLAMAYELKSPRIGVWTRQGWIQGWKNIGYDLLISSCRRVVIVGYQL